MLHIDRSSVFFQFVSICKLLREYFENHTLFFLRKVYFQQMSPLINISVDNLLELFEERCKSGKAFNIHR